MRRKKQRRVAKDKVYKSVPKKYLSGTNVAKIIQRGRDIKIMQRLYKAGKKVPKSLLKRVFG